MSNLEEIWSKYNSIFFLFQSDSDKAKINFIDIAKQTSQKVGLNHKQVFITYDNNFIQFDQVIVPEIQDYLETLITVTNNYFSDLNLIPTLSIYGIYYGLLNRLNLETKYVVALGSKIVVVDKLEDIPALDLHLAISESFEKFTT